MIIILKSLYFFIPAYFANIAPVFAAKIFPKFDYPIDLHIKIRGKRLLGSHKTIRGLISGTLTAIISCLVQYQLHIRYGFFSSLALVEYTPGLAISLGFMLGFGALAGDAAESLFKRRLGIKPGKSWILFDQIDFVIGGILFSIGFMNDITAILSILIISPFLSVIATRIGYHLKIRKEKW